MIKCALFLWRCSPGRFLMAMILTILGGFSAIVLLACANIVLRQQSGNKEVIFWSFAGLCLVLPLSRFVAEILISRTVQYTVFGLQMRLSKKIAGAPLRFLEEHGTHRLLSVLIRDIDAFDHALANIPVSCLNLTVVASGLIYLGWLSRAVFVIALGFGVLCIIVYRFPASWAAKSLRLAQQAGDGLYHHFSSLMGGAKELKLHQRRRHAFFSQVLHSSASSVRDHNVSGLTASSVAAALAQTSAFVLIGALLLAVPLFNLNPQGRFGYTMVLIFMMAPMQVLLSAVAGFERGEVALERIQGLEYKLTALHADVDSPVLSDLPYDFRCLDLVEVTHAYHREGETNDFILGPMNLTLVPGEVIFVVGGNGSGKTTLAKLLAGLYVPANGQVYLNNQIVTDSNREHYRQYFSVVFADFHLFDRLLGLESSQLDEHARRYLVQLELDDEVEIKDGILSTTELSQGQRKRLALLTAYLEDRPIYVFDEWAADQDPSFKRVFYRVLLPELRAKGKTVVVISHDERYYDVADRLIRLDCGRIVEAPSVAQTT
jgi:putative ATP-binding cassette transporter